MVPIHSSISCVGMPKKYHEPFRGGKRKRKKEEEKEEGKKRSWQGGKKVYQNRWWPVGSTWWAVHDGR